MYRLQQGEGEDALADAVLELVHYPGIGDLVDQHQHDKIGGEIAAECNFPRCRRCRLKLPTRL